MKKYFLLLTIVLLSLLTACGSEPPADTAQNDLDMHLGILPPEVGDSNNAAQPQDTAQTETHIGVETQVAPEILARHQMLHRIAYGGNVAYIISERGEGGGSPGQFPLAPMVEGAMRRADTFVFETEWDTREQQDDDASMQRWERVFLPDGLTLEAVLPYDILSNLSAQLTTYGFYYGTPGFVTMTPLGFLHNFRHMMSPTSSLAQTHSVVNYMRDFADEYNLQVLALTSDGATIDLMFDMPIEQQIGYLRNFPGMTEAITALMDGEDPFSIRHDGWDEWNYWLSDGIAALLRDTNEPTTFFVTISAPDEDYEAILQNLSSDGFETVALWEGVLIPDLDEHAARGNEVRVLWVGPHPTATGETPAQFAQIAMGNGVVLRHSTVGPGNLGELTAAVMAQLATQQYDYVIMQDAFVRSFWDLSGFLQDVVNISAAARSFGATPILVNAAFRYEGWSVEDNLDAMTLHHEYAAFISDAQFIDIARAWVHTGHRYPGMDMFMPDGFSASRRGGFFNASIFASELLGIRVTESSPWWYYDSAYVERLGRLAWDFVNQ